MSGCAAGPINAESGNVVPAFAGTNASVSHRCAAVRVEDGSEIKFVNRNGVGGLMSPAGSIEATQNVDSGEFTGANVMIADPSAPAHCANSTTPVLAAGAPQPGGRAPRTGVVVSVVPAGACQYSSRPVDAFRFTESTSNVCPPAAGVNCTRNVE